MNVLFASLSLCLGSCPVAMTTPEPLEQSVQETLDIRIPVVDMRDFYDQERRDAFIETMHYAMTKIGFFAVRNTGVNRETIRKAYEEAEIFFKSAQEVKEQCFNPKTRGQRGFVPGEKAKGCQAKDFKEFYHVGRELSSEALGRFGLAANVWPDQPEFKESMVSLYGELDQYVRPLLETVVAVINKDAKAPIAANFFEPIMEGGDSLLRALYYPALTSEQMQELKKPLYWAAAHTDIDLLAILPYSTAKGLQVQLNGQWLNVVVPEDAFVVNVGDMLENMTNGLFVSARHRVLAQEPGKERFSMVLFVHPISDADLSPFATCIEQTGGVQRYAPGTRKEFLWERLLELNIAPGLLEPYSKTGHTERQMLFDRESPQVVEMLISSGFASPELLAKQLGARD